MNSGVKLSVRFNGKLSIDIHVVIKYKLTCYFEMKDQKSSKLSHSKWLQRNTVLNFSFSDESKDLPNSSGKSILNLNFSKDSPFQMKTLKYFLKIRHLMSFD